MTVLTKFPTATSSVGFSSPDSIDTVDVTKATATLPPFGDAANISAYFGMSFAAGTVISSVLIRTYNWDVSDPSISLGVRWITNNGDNFGPWHYVSSSSDTFDVTSEYTWIAAELVDSVNFVVEVNADPSASSTGGIAEINAVSVTVTYSTVAIVGLTASSKVVGSPTIGSPTLHVKNILTSVGKSVSSPSIGAPNATTSTSSHSTSLSVGSPTIGVPVFVPSFIPYWNAVSLNTGRPSIGVPTCAAYSGSGAIGITTSSPSIGTPAFAQRNKLTAAGLNVGSPTLAVPLIGHVVYSIAAQNLNVGSPSIGQPLISGVISLIPVSLNVTGAISLGLPRVFTFYTLKSTSLSVASPQIDAPILEWYPPDPMVVCVTNRDNGDQEALFTNTNIDFVLEIQPGLVGRTAPPDYEAGPAHRIIVQAPLILKDNTLSVDISDVYNQLSLIWRLLNVPGAMNVNVSQPTIGVPMLGIN